MAREVARIRLGHAVIEDIDRIAPVLRAAVCDKPDAMIEAVGSRIDSVAGSTSTYSAMLPGKRMRHANRRSRH